MSTTLDISGFVPPDDKWKLMKSIWDACTKAHVDIPKEVGDFFDWNTPTDNGREVSMRKLATEISEDGRYGYEIDVDKIPKNIKRMRFCVIC